MKRPEPQHDGDSIAPSIGRPGRSVRRSYTFPFELTPAVDHHVSAFPPSFSSLICSIMTASALASRSAPEIRHPAAEYLVGESELTGLVVDLDTSPCGNPSATSRPARRRIPDFCGPLLECRVMGDATLQCDRLILRAARRLARRRGSPPSRCSITSVERLSALILETPATYWLSHFTRNLKFL